MSNHETEEKCKRINSQSEAKIRLKQLLIGFVIFWIIWGVIILIFGDEKLALAINPGFEIDESYWSYKIIKFYSDSFIGIVLGTILVTIIVLSVPKLKAYRRPMLEAFFSMAIASIFVESLKTIVGRIRPFQEGSPIADQINTFGETTDSGSMPSGHVAYSGAAVLPHAIWLKSKIISGIISIYIAGMMYVRMFLGVHYATDVLVGSIISLGSAIGVFFLFERIYRNGTIPRKIEWGLFVFGLVMYIVMQVILN
jgi:membrane-associated phospholipid phosphatase